MALIKPNQEDISRVYKTLAKFYEERFFDKIEEKNLDSLDQNIDDFFLYYLQPLVNNTSGNFTRFLFWAAACEGLARHPPEANMANAWGVDRCTIDDPDFYKRVELFKRVCGEENIPFEDDDRMVLMSNPTQYNERVKKLPGYYPATAERRLYEDTFVRKNLTPHFDNAIVIEVCGGDAQVSMELWKAIKSRGYEPAYWIHNDISAESVMNGYINLSNLISAQKLREVHSNIMSDRFWNMPMLAQLRKLRNPIILIIHTSTFSNFHSEERHRFLTSAARFLRSHDDIFMIVGDNTRHEPTVREAYDHPCHKAFFLGNYIAVNKIVREIINQRELGATLAKRLGGEIFGRLFAEPLNYDKLDLEIRFDIAKTNRVGFYAKDNGRETLCGISDKLSVEQVCEDNFKYHGFRTNEVEVYRAPFENPNIDFNAILVPR